MTNKQPFGWNEMNPVFSDDLCNITVKVTRQQLHVLMASRDMWFEFLKLCNSAGYKDETSRIGLAKDVLRAGIDAAKITLLDEDSAIEKKSLALRDSPN